jgi:hypothetical protein
MSMRANTIVTHLRPEDALTLIEFLDQVRDVLVHTYGDEVKAMQQASSHHSPMNRNEREVF